MYRLLLSLLNIFVIGNADKLKNIPSCSTCKWFINNINNDYGRCKLFLHSPNKNPPTFPIYKFTKICREKESFCGKEGKFFENKEFLDNNKTYEIKQLIDDYSNFIYRK